MLNVTSGDPEEIDRVTEDARNYILSIVGRENEKRVLYPRNAANFKGHDAYRQYIIIKAPRGKRNEYVHYLDQYRKKLMQERSGANITIDVNPYSII